MLFLENVLDDLDSANKIKFLNCRSDYQVFGLRSLQKLASNAYVIRKVDNETFVCWNLSWHTNMLSLVNDLTSIYQLELGIFSVNISALS